MISIGNDETRNTALLLSLHSLYSVNIPPQSEQATATQYEEKNPLFLHSLHALIN